MNTPTEIIEEIIKVLEALEPHRDDDLLSRLPEISTATKLKSLQHCLGLAQRLQRIALSRTQLEKES